MMIPTRCIVFVTISMHGSILFLLLLLSFIYLSYDVIDVVDAVDNDDDDNGFIIKQDIIPLLYNNISNSISNDTDNSILYLIMRWLG